MEQSGNNFIQTKYPDTKSSQERKDILTQALESEELTESQKRRLEERALPLPDRLSALQKTNPKVHNSLLERFTEESVLDVLDEDLILKLAKALYESEKRVAIERGQQGDVQNLESSDTELLAKYKNAIVEKYEIQKRTLASWLTYIQANDANYPAWFLYYMMRSLKDMGQFSRDEVTYQTRTNTTIAPFPEMNAESIAFVKKSLNLQLEVESITIPKEIEETIIKGTILSEEVEKKISSLPIDKQEDAKKGALRNARASARKTYLDEHKLIKQETFLKDVSLDDKRRDELEEELSKRLHSKNFVELYAFAQVETAGKLDRESLVGEWVKYPQGSDYTLLERGLQGKGTGWCTAEGSAKGQLEAGDFYVFYTNNKNGVPTEPRIAIRMADNHIAEIRGVNERQALEPELIDTAKEFYKDLPGSQKYEKRDKDMRQMTSLYTKCVTIDKITKEKIYHTTSLTREELLFLYEVHGTIEGFGYDRDPRIEELRQKRNRQEDILTLCACEQSQIVKDQMDITEDTLVYYEDDGESLTFFDYREGGNIDKRPRHIEFAKQLKEAGSPARLDMSIEGGIINLEIDQNLVESLSTFDKAQKAYKGADGASPSWIWEKLKGIPYIKPEVSNLDVLVLNHKKTLPQERDKLVADMDKAGYRPLEFSELIALGIIKPEYNKRNEILNTYKKYTLGGVLLVPYLLWRGDERKLSADGCDSEWFERIRFLFVHK